MAFTGTPIVTKISDRVVRITTTLANGAAGTIGLFEGVGEVDLPDNFNPQPYGTVDLAEAIEVSITFQGPAIGETPPQSRLPAFQVVKAASPFLATVTNQAADSAVDLEIYLRFH